MEVTATIANVSQAAVETGGGANAVLAEADGLAKQSEELRGEIVAFLREAKAA